MYGPSITNLVVILKEKVRDKTMLGAYILIIITYSYHDHLHAKGSFERESVITGLD